MGKKTILIDLDLQINASITALGNCEDDFLPWRCHQTIEDYLENRWQRRDPNPNWYFLNCGRINLLSGSPSLMLFERRCLAACEQVAKAKTFLSQWMAEIISEAKGKFDLVICDTPPGLSLLAEAAIRMADQIVVPQVPDRLSTQGIQLYARYLRDDLQLHGIAQRTNVFINRYSPNRVISKTYADQIQLNAGRPIFPYKCFRNRYTDTEVYKKAMDRAELTEANNVAFNSLWGSVSSEVIAATQELWELLGWIEEDESEPIIEPSPEIDPPLYHF